AAYSLRKLSSTYTGPAIRVRRSSDDAEQDIGFGADDFLDTAALTAFVGSGDGYVTTWYDQTGGEAMTNTDVTRQPKIVDQGQIITTDTGKPAIYFLDKFDSPSGTSTYLSSADRATTLEITNYFFSMVVKRDVDHDMENTFGGIDTRGRAHEGAWYRGIQSYINTSSARAGLSGKGLVESLFRPIMMRNRGDRAEFWQGNTLLNTLDSAGEPDLDSPKTLDQVHVGGSSSEDNGFTGYVTELIVFPWYGDDSWPINYYVDAAGAWEAGTTDWNEDAILPQLFDYQVVLYDWLETLTVEDVTLKLGQTFTFDETLLSDDDLADLWVMAENLTTSRVVRGEPEWYVLDAGNGKGIEATGEVRVWHEPGSGYGGNPARSWANEPAQLYALDIPLSGGGRGNPYYKDPAMGRRAMVVAIVDMMMYHQELLSGNFATWGDMFGKAFLSWAEAYRWAGEVLPQNVRDAFEEGMGYFLDHAVTSDVAPRAVNTNMDMFFIHGAAEFYMATSNQTLKDKCLQAVKRWLFGYTDGELEVKHKVFPLDGTTPRGGVFSPSGYIMEGDQPDFFYGGESLYHLTGALAAVMDRDTGTVPTEWEFIKEVVRRFEEWRLYQYWYEPGVASAGTGGIRPAYRYHGGAGFAGRTGNGAPSGQASGAKYKVIADFFLDLRYDGIYSVEHNSSLKDRQTMIDDIVDALAERTTEMQSVYEGTPNTWAGWSPWTKETEYLPAKGWYSRLKALEGDPSTFPPSARPGYYYNKPFGGPPTGYEYWAYKNTDGTTEWGFFMEAQAHQGGYNGWYGGKIETFWTEKTGVILINRHGKAGCDAADKEDSSCWDNLEYKAAHHVWGRDENGKGFTTLLLRGHDLQRTSVFDLGATTPSVTVTNIFNDPSYTENPTSSKTGEETGYELEGQVTIANKIEALSNGVRVTHTVTSDGTDMITELWASIPVFLRLYNPLVAGTKPQEDLDDTTIEYWDGTSWQLMPEDLNGDGFPELVTTTKLRLGRDFLLGDGPQYVYVGFDAPQKVRLSTQKYYDPYQTQTGVRTVHFDMHGNPGTVIPMPTNKSLQYTITTTEPDSGGDTGVRTQTLNLEEGWNTVSFNVVPTNPSVE
ncbi:MAG: hypothetical protein D6820_05045, partial [Lentisphaerae bacterium]